MSRKSFRSILSSISCFAAIAAPFVVHAHTGVFVTGNEMYMFDTNSPGTLPYSRTLSGLGAGEQIVGLDYRPATNQLFALGSQSRLYVIDPASGVATQVGANGAFTLTGTAFGFDFNPTVDRIRVVSDADQNLRLNPANGTIAATDTNLQYAAGDPNFGANPNVVAAAYTNNFAGASTTTLYGIDSNLNTLVIQNPPNTGTLTTVGPLGVGTLGAAVSFDIVTEAGGNSGYLVLQTGPLDNSLYRVNLATGAATVISSLFVGGPVTAFAVAPSAFLRNVSTRGLVATGDNVMIGGFIIQGQGPQTVVVRARGPSLAALGVPNVLQNPQMALYAGQTPIASNDNWGDAPNAAAIQATGYAPSNAQESAILVTLNPGGYTAIVTGVGGTTGIAIVEVFTVP